MSDPTGTLDDYGSTGSAKERKRENIFERSRRVIGDSQPEILQGRAKRTKARQSLSLSLLTGVNEGQVQTRIRNHLAGGENKFLKHNSMLIVHSSNWRPIINTLRAGDTAGELKYIWPSLRKRFCGYANLRLQHSLKLTSSQGSSCWSRRHSMIIGLRQHFPLTSPNYTLMSRSPRHQSLQKSLQGSLHLLTPALGRLHRRQMSNLCL
jgi:hypothetical protein